MSLPVIEAHCEYRRSARYGNSRILAELQQDGSLTNVELARAVNLSASACLNRVRNLERSGIIARLLPAGTPFAMSVSALIYELNTPAPNFGREAVPKQIALRDPEGVDILRHSAAHVLATAVRLAAAGLMALAHEAPPSVGSTIIGTNASSRRALIAEASLDHATSLLEGAAFPDWAPG